nr:MAG TPA: hypothetical protein [Caudoviricetes sp.]
MENPKTYIQLLAISVEIMQANDLEEVFATEDGQVFYEKNRAQLHASSIESKVYTFDNSKSVKLSNKTQQIKKDKEGKTDPPKVEGASVQGKTETEAPTEDDEQKTE